MYPNPCCGQIPEYGGARAPGRRPRGYRALGSYFGLGQAAITLKGTARYYTGEITETWRRDPTPTWCDVCESYKTRFPNAEHKCNPAGSMIDNATQQSRPTCYHYIKHTVKDLRPGVMGAQGDKGWAVYVKDLIPTTGGSLPGYVRLQGAIPGTIKDGQEITITGAWVGTPPNNLCVNCGWDFNVQSEAPSGTPVTPGSGAIDQNAPEMIDARIEATGIQAERQALAEGATPAEAQEVRQRTEAELKAKRSGLEAPAEDGPPLTTAGISAGAVAGVVLAGMLILPLLSKKGRKARGPVGVQRWGI